MLYGVSYSNGAVGIFSSMDKVKELVLDNYPSITFITQVYKSSDKPDVIDGKSIAWVIIYKDTEFFAYISDNKEEASNALLIFDKLGRVYEEEIDYCEQEIDVISECVTRVLDSLQNAYGENGIIVDSSDNIIYYV